jgi:hypothetical protein
MKTSVKVKTPIKATVHFFSYMDRGTQKAMRSVLSDYPQVDMGAAQEKFKKISDEKDEKKKLELLKDVSNDEQEAVFDLQEVMVRGLVEKIVREDTGAELPPSDNAWFFGRMSPVDFTELSLCVSEIVSQTAEEEKKTK